MDELSGALQIAKKGYDQIKASFGKDDKYAHITDEDMKHASKTIQDKWTWFEDALTTFARTPRTQLPSITVAQIRSEKMVR